MNFSFYFFADCAIFITENKILYVFVTFHLASKLNQNTLTYFFYSGYLYRRLWLTMGIELHLCIQKPCEEITVRYHIFPVVLVCLNDQLPLNCKSFLISNLY